MTWIEKLATKESLDLAVVRNGDQAAKLAELKQFVRALKAIPEWKALILPATVTLTLVGPDALNTLLADVFLCGAKAARRLAEVDALEGMVRE